MVGTSFFVVSDKILIFVSSNAVTGFETQFESAFAVMAGTLFAYKGCYCDLNVT